MLGVARDIVAQRGLGELSLREIADRASVNPALLNYYFGGLDALQGEMITRALERVDALLAELRVETPMDELVRRFGALLQDNKELAQLLLSPVFLSQEAPPMAKSTRLKMREFCAARFMCNAQNSDAMTALFVSILCAPLISGEQPSALELHAYEELARNALSGLQAPQS